MCEVWKPFFLQNLKGIIHLSVKGTILVNIFKVTPVLELY